MVSKRLEIQTMNWIDHLKKDLLDNKIYRERRQNIIEESGYGIALRELEESNEERVRNMGEERRYRVYLAEQEEAFNMPAWAKGR